MSYLIDYLTEIEVLSCCECGISFGMPKELKDKLYNNGKLFYCPNGHPQHFTRKKSLEQKLAEKQRALKAEREYSNSLYEEKEEYKRKMVGQKIQKAKILNRIKKGVCPHCNRYFENLHEHMKTKHFKDNGKETNTGKDPAGQM